MQPLGSAIWVSSIGLRAGPNSVAPSTADLDVTLPDTFLIHHDLVSAFEVGWAVLHEDVSMFVAEQLSSRYRTCDAAMLTSRKGWTPFGSSSRSNVKQARRGARAMPST